MTELDTDERIENLATRALDAGLPRAEWTHEAHFALALWTLRHRPELGEPDAFREIILRLNRAHGTPNTDSEGYHHTVTVASLRAANAVLREFDPSEPLDRVLARLMESKFARSDWILAYWTRDLLFSVTARRAWVGPDLAELPF